MVDDNCSQWDVKQNAQTLLKFLNKGLGGAHFAESKNYLRLFHIVTNVWYWMVQLQETSRLFDIKKI